MARARGSILAIWLAAPVLVGGFVAGAAPADAVQLVRLDAAHVLADAHQGHVTLELPGRTLTLDLMPNPIAEGAAWGEGGVAGGRTTETVTFKGRTSEGAAVRLAATAIGVFAVVFEADPVYIEPAWLTAPGAAPTLHRFAYGTQSPMTIGAHPDPAPSLLSVETGSAGGLAGRTVRFLVESDIAFHQRFSPTALCASTVNPPCWAQVQQAAFNVAEHAFEQVGIAFQITSQWTCVTPAACPYPSIAQSMGTWRIAFADRWEAVTTEPAHDLGHLLIGTNLPSFSGVSSLATVATPDGYAVSEFGAVLPLDSFFGVPVPNAGLLAWAVPAHEIGHNFNGVHGQADPVPPALATTGGLGVVYTIMDPSHPVQYQFSDGTYDPGHNNAERIVAHALERLAA